MARRSRKYIPLKEKLAAALAMLLPPSDRDVFRGAKAPASIIVGMFDFDHVVLHAHAGSDRWHNLTPMLRGLHRAKSRRDISIAAKTKRLREAPTVAAGAPKPKAGVNHRAARKRATGAPTKPWSRPLAGTIRSGWRKRLNGQVERR